VSSGHSSLPFLDDRILLNLAAYWSAKRGQHPMPARSAIDPLDMPRRLLPHLALVEPTGQDREIRFRLVGTELVQRFGRDSTGKTSTELYGGSDYLGHLEGIYGAVFADAQPLFVESIRAWREDGHGRMRRLLLPVAAAEGDARAAFVLSALSWSAVEADSDGGRQTPPTLQRRIDVEVMEKGVLQATFRGLLGPL
jgi:hypothetical protein